MIRVLAVASELFPVVKTGGLGDVTGALPSALKDAGAEVVTVMPGYPSVMNGLADVVPVHQFADLFGGSATVYRGTIGSVDLLAIDAPHLYARAGTPYLGPDGQEWSDNGIRFAGLGAAAAAIAAGAMPSVNFDILHAHDWQAAMAVVYLHFHPGPRPGTVLTIHNLAFQGRYAAALFPRLGLPAAAFNVDGLEFYGDLNLLKGGLSYADRITTVSPTYAEEITERDNGMGLDGLLRQRSTAMSGILNGIDTFHWNPTSDSLIPQQFTRSSLKRRAVNKAVLQDRMGLEASRDALLVGVVSRLTSQKGLDMVLDQLDFMVASGMQIALLGSGDQELEQAFAVVAASHRGKVGCVIGYDEKLAHMIQAGSDTLLVPSRFEPCGLTQLCALHYGAIPIVSRVGGLADTVIDANEAAMAAGVATGLQFWPPTSRELACTLQRLLKIWRNRALWTRMQRNGMAADVSWQAPAKRYVELYQSVMANQP